ncbi:MAG TPA: hypothetical protein VGP72_33385 [Planctomycetota bacterium]|jgi:outer membrane protein assembly factor BamB
MSGHVTKALLALLVISFAAYPADKDKDKPKSDPKNTAELFTPPAALLEKEKRERNVAAEIDAEVAARAVPVPPAMDLDLEWYSPHIDAAKYGVLIKGWVSDEIVLLETDKHNLLCVRRDNGVEKWRCELTDAIRYAPAISRNNVVVNVNNYLVGIERNAGYIRWKLLPNFVMSCSPIVIDPPTYPKEYTRQWKQLENVFVGGWDGRLYCMFVRARLGFLVKHRQTEDFSAPEFDLFQAWHKTHRSRGVISSDIVVKENTLYYVADDHNVYATNREGEEREPYYMLGSPTTSITVTAPPAANVTNSVLNSIYCGASDNYFYCLDRLTLRKKWAFPLGISPVGDIMADEAITPMVYAMTANGIFHALQIQPARSVKGQAEIPESYSEAWTAPAAGALCVGPDLVYLGTNKLKDAPGYGGVTVVSKADGKVQWKVEGGFFTQFLPYFNLWTKPGQEAHVYALSSDNRLVSLKEKVRETGIRLIKAPTPEPEMPKVIIGKAKPAGEKPAEKADEKKADEKKADEKKADEKKEEPKKEEPKKEEPKAEDKKEEKKADEKKAEEKK